MTQTNGTAKRNGQPSKERFLALAAQETPLPPPKQPRPSSDGWASGLWSRMIVAGGLVLVAFSLPRFVEPRAVDPGRGWLIIEPLAGLLLFWPLSRAFLRSMPRLFALAFALLPALILIGIRLYGSERSVTDGTHANTSFGAMIFLGVCSLAAYFLFGRSPKNEGS